MEIQWKSPFSYGKTWNSHGNPVEIIIFLWKNMEFPWKSRGNRNFPMEKQRNLAPTVAPWLPVRALLRRAQRRLERCDRRRRRAEFGPGPAAAAVAGAAGRAGFWALYLYVNVCISIIYT